MRTAEECAIAEIRAAKDANRLVPRGNSHAIYESWAVVGSVVWYYLHVTWHQRDEYIGSRIVGIDHLIMYVRCCLGGNLFQMIGTTGTRAVG